MRRLDALNPYNLIRIMPAEEERDLPYPDIYPRLRPVHGQMEELL
jgi:hypothetical protein